MDIVCRKCACKYNKQQKCMRKHLKVDKMADCDDLDIDRNKATIDVSKDMFAHEPDLEKFTNCKNVKITCDAKDCVFNKKQECFSNGIFVGCAKACAPCNSYQER